MEWRTCYLVCLLTLSLAGSASSQAVDITVAYQATSESLMMTCENGLWPEKGDVVENKTWQIAYKDENSMRYICQSNSDPTDQKWIYVKFRTCDNCIALEAGTVAGILVGEIVATALIGVAVYLIASQPQGKAYRQGNKASDRQNLIQNQHNDTTYQPLGLITASFSLGVSSSQPTLGPPSAQPA
ncbi:hypothetical protein AGOR_G00121970 [Albula goreensis]|uniref:T-cell surface glycoprotein CD3 gamma chain n=1 Tax=Albula goreensis TaxID=1534307 RepID=A0A8T3D6Q6_9TELE|nr:hypothetical protein AGOR_G00121970 [Albula goreensis]